MNLTTKLNQTAVYWAPDDVTGDGNRTFAAPVETSVRWQDVRELFLNAQGEKELSNAVIYFDGSGTAIVLDGKLFLGTLADLSAPEEANPNIVRLAYRVRGNNLSPSLQATQSLRKAFL